MPPKLLEVLNLSARYGGVQALHDVSLTVAEGNLVTVIGANGAGKTSLLNAVAGVIPKQGGSVLYNGEDISRALPEDLVARGITLVPERRELFGSMTVLDNLELGAFHRFQKRDKNISKDLEAVFSTFPRLAERRKQLAGTMSGGEQQMLAIGRALMSRPKLLLLDEPSLGLAPLIVKEIFTVIKTLKDAGNTVLLIEQNARAALTLADYGYLLETGEVKLAAPAKELMQDKAVAEAYLGINK